jgi:hypothetical protein
MRVHSVKRWPCKRTIWIISCTALVSIAFFFPADGDTRAADAREDRGYVGSVVCAKCHSGIYESFSRTDMGRSMAGVTSALFQQLPTSAGIFDPKLNRHFAVYARDGALYQSEFGTDANGKELFRNTQKIRWIIGAGANGSGAIVERDGHLFEAPLSYYSKIKSWALSPGYEFGDYGFDRPILPGCISCHSGRAQTTADGNGHFRNPPFTELAIGCENCHGPGAVHVALAEISSSPGAITNPATLSPWLADNICMSCHQTGDARVLQAGKSYSDFQPGTELDHTLAIFLVPFTRATAPKDDLLEHYLSMRLSKCYLASKGRLSCIACHNPHEQPSAAEAPAYFRQKCLACHTEKSCALPLALRQHKTPPDDCVGCHMPKRDVTVISHSVLTNHRIVADIDEPFPDAAFQLSSAAVPELVHLSANPAEPDQVPLLTQLEAYGEVMLSHPEYRERYWAVAKQLQASEPRNIVVLDALADFALHANGTQGGARAIEFLSHAVQEGSTNAADFEQLATLLIESGRQADALRVLQAGIRALPFRAELYRLAAKTYASMGKNQEACELATSATQEFPQDEGFRVAASQCLKNSGASP